MRLHSDILRGVRLAAVAFVLVLLGALVYRSVDLAAKNRTAPVPQVVVTPATPPAPTPAADPDPPPAPPPSQTVPKQGGLIAQVRVTGARSAANPSTRKAAAAGSKSEPEAAETGADSSEPPHTDTAAVDKEEVQADPPEEAATPAVANPAEASAEAVPTENRGKRMIKAVGRFLRIGGKKDVEPQPAAPARPKSNQQ